MKKLTIKPFKAGVPKLPPQFKDTTWEKLKKAVGSVYEKMAVQESKEELYRAVEDLCMHKLGSWLYEELSGVCRAHIFELVDGLIGKTSDQTQYLETVDGVWKEHCDQMITLRNIFLHLDRNFSPPVLQNGENHQNGGNIIMLFGKQGQAQQAGVNSLWDMGMYYFRERMESRADLESALVVGLLACVEADRLNVAFDEYITKRLLRMLVTLGLYHSKFEAPFLIDSERFFLHEGQAMVQTCDPAAFLMHTERRLAEAMEMTAKYLDASTKIPLLSIIEATLLRPHASLLIERGLMGLLEANRVVDLRRMYVLLDRVGEAEGMRQGWVAYIREAGEKLVSDPSKDREKTLIEDLLQLHDRMGTVLAQVFSTGEAFKLSLKGAWEYVINIHPNKFAEFLAKYLDRKMRAEKGQTEADSDRTLNRALVFFRFLYAKDIFEAFYRKLLSKRLLGTKTASTEMEKAMVTKLKTECGANYTSKLEGMLQDELVSEEVKRAFKAEKKWVPDFEPKVLTVGYWPIVLPTANALKLPTNLVSLRTHFDEYYTSKYQGRRLAWVNAVDRCVVTARLPKGKKELDVNLYQALCLIQFNAGSLEKQLSFKDLSLATGMEEGDLKRTLQSLACGMIGTRVLTKEPKGKDVSPDDRFLVNKDFQSKLFRVNIRVIVPREVADEDAQKTHDEVFRDRQYSVDAIVVRVMKTRKRCSHTDLMGEILAQIRFPAQPADIKKRIESLIEREYLERDADDSGTYNYLA